jgi:hypothetical protein
MATLIKIHPNGIKEMKDSGERVESIKYDDNGKFVGIVGNKPIVGCSLLVGSVTARSYASQDYWITTAITEIVEETNEYILFKTGNSTYELIIS